MRDLVSRTVRMPSTRSGSSVVIRRASGQPQAGLHLRTSAVVRGQVWRSGEGRQARLARFRRAVDVCSVDERMGRLALARAGTSDPIDATVVLVAETGDRIVTSDRTDIDRLVAPAARGPPRSHAEVLN